MFCFQLKGEEPYKYRPPVQPPIAPPYYFSKDAKFNAPDCTTAKASKIQTENVECISKKLDSVKIEFDEQTEIPYIFTEYPLSDQLQTVTTSNLTRTQELSDKNELAELQSIYEENNIKASPEVLNRMLEHLKQSDTCTCNL